MNWMWQPMSAEEFAAFEQLLGQKLLQVEGVFWSRVRPMFYRPLLLFEEYSGSLSAPKTAVLGGFHHAVPADEKANSFLNLLMFENIAGYSIDTLDYNRK